VNQSPIGQLIGTIFCRHLIRPENGRFYFASQQIYLVAFLLHVLFLIVFQWLGIKELVFFNISSLVLYAFVLLLNRKGLHELAIGSAYIEVNAHATLAVLLLGWGAGFFYYLLAIGPMLLFYPRYHLILKIAPAALSVLLLMGLFYYSIDHPPYYVLSHPVMTTLYVGNMVSIFGLLSYLAHYYAAGADQSETQLRKLSETFEQQAISDSLTGLFNRRAATQEVNAEIGRFHRNAEPFALVLGDIDDFKRYNDKYGHQAGDQVIKHVADLLVNNTRPYDIISRWGGEEFLIMLPGCTLKESVKIINTLRETISTHPLSYKHHTIEITVTFGIAEFGRASTLNDAIEAADQALYSGKKNGKNRVETASLSRSGEYIVEE
jgi:diguanylate cyclase (GGDEF)-like protein